MTKETNHFDSQRPKDQQKKFPAWAQSVLIVLGVFAILGGCVTAIILGRGYEFDKERTELERNAEIWINWKTGMGMRIRWFRLKS